MKLCHEQSYSFHKSHLGKTPNGVFRLNARMVFLPYVIGPVIVCSFVTKSASKRAVFGISESEQTKLHVCKHVIITPSSTTVTICFGDEADQIGRAHV